MALSLEEVKKYLRVDYDDENAAIQDLIDSAEIYVDVSCGENYKKHEHLVSLSNIAKRKLISNMFEKRDTNSDDQRDIMITTIFDVLSHAE